MISAKEFGLLLNTLHEFTVGSIEEKEYTKPELERLCHLAEYCYCPKFCETHL